MCVGLVLLLVYCLEVRFKPCLEVRFEPCLEFHLVSTALKKGFGIRCPIFLRIFSTKNADLFRWSEQDKPDQHQGKEKDIMQ